MFIIVTGDSRGYAFIEFTNERSCQEAYRVRHTLWRRVLLKIFEYIYFKKFHIVCIQDDD
jgi:RNA recognition motif-containing protein